MGATNHNQWQAALPAIRDRLEALHGQVDQDVVQSCVARAIADTSSARIQTYRAILVERRADRLLRHHESMPVRAAETDLHEAVGVP
jgi:hypothetical protein